MPRNLENPAPPGRIRFLLALAAVAGSMVWAYWTTLESMARKWTDDSQYSHGFVVIPFALFLLWTRRAERPAPLPGPSAWGLALLAVGTLVRLAGARFYYDWFEGTSLLLCLAGFVLLAGGPALLRWAWPAIAFLLFMVPLPYRLESALSGVLQQTATSSSAALLHTLGRPAVADGNVLEIGDERIEVVAACSGLGSLLVFFAMAAAAALLSGRPLFDRGLLVLSAIPIALGTNAIRIAATVLLREAYGERASYETLHGLAGWLMMALALGALRVELWLLRLVFIEPAKASCDASSS